MKNTLILSLILCRSLLPAQTFQWALQEHYSAQNRSESVGNDKWGNVYITGRFIPSYNGMWGNTYGAIVSKYTASGSLVWSDTILNVREIKSTVDSSGNIYATGYFRFNSTFGGVTFNASGWSGGFQVKYNSNGQVVWAKNTYGFGITLSKNSQDVYITSTDGGSIDTSVVNGGIISKYSNSGNIIWDANIKVKNKGGLGYCRANSISVDKNNNAYISGQFKDTVTFGAGSNTITLIYNGPYNNNFIAKYDSAGNFKWATEPAIPSYGFESQFPFYISCDTAGNAFITGTFYNTLAVGATTYSAGNNAFILLGKLDPSGNLLWSKSISGTVNNLVYGIAHDKKQNFYLTGGFGGTTDFGNGVIMSSNCAAFAVKFDKNATPQWVAHPTQTNNACSTGLGIHADNNGNVYMVGQVSGSTTTFGSTNLSTPQYTDLFLTQIKDNQVNTSLNSNAFNLLKDNLFSIYPNPTAGFLNISSKDYAAGKTEIKISNVIGQCIFSKSCKTSGTEFNEQVDLSAYPKGIYFVEINSEQGKEVKKVILE